MSPAKAALYLNWSEYITWLNPRLRSYDQFLMTDSTAGNFATGLRFPSGKEKPSYGAFRMPLYLPRTSGAKGDALEVWGCVRPAPDAEQTSHRRQRVKIQFAPASGGSFKTVKTVPITEPHGYFDLQQHFSGSGQRPALLDLSARADGVQPDRRHQPALGAAGLDRAGCRSSRPIEPNRGRRRNFESRELLSNYAQIHALDRYSAGRR